MFFELIQVAVGNRTALSRVPSEDEWQEMYALSKEHALQGVLFDAMKRLPSEQQPEPILAMKWFGVTQKIIVKSKRAFESCAALSWDMENNHKRHIILKGQGMAMLYPNPLLRTSGDIDVWVPGKRKDTLDYILQLTEVGAIVYHHCQVKLRNDMEVEIHFTPSFMYSYRLNRRLQHYFKSVLSGDCVKKVSSPEGHGYFYVASLALSRVHSLIHIFRHLFSEGIGLRQLMDYYYILHQGFSEQERLEAIRVFKTLHLLKFAGAVMYVEQLVFGLESQYCLVEVEPNLGKFLLSEIMQSGNFGRADKRILHDKNESTCDLFLLHVKRNLRFFRYFPEEVLFTPLYKIWHYSWRKYHGWV